MNPRLVDQGHETLRPSEKDINAAAQRTECAADDAEEGCGNCGEGEAGSRDTMRIPTPYKPSQAEVDEHNLTHLPFRSWCRHCIRGRAKETSHLQQAGEERTVPEFHMDFCFPGNEESAEEHLTVLVIRMGAKSW